MGKPLKTIQGPTRCGLMGFSRLHLVFWVFLAHAKNPHTTTTQNTSIRTELCRTNNWEPPQNELIMSAVPRRIMAQKSRNGLDSEWRDLESISELREHTNQRNQPSRLVVQSVTPHPTADLPARVVTYSQGNHWPMNWLQQIS